MSEVVNLDRNAPDENKGGKKCTNKKSEKDLYLYNGFWSGSFKLSKWHPAFWYQYGILVRYTPTSLLALHQIPTYELLQHVQSGADPVVVTGVLAVQQPATQQPATEEPDTQIVLYNDEAPRSLLSKLLKIKLRYIVIFIILFPFIIEHASLLLIASIVHYFGFREIYCLPPLKVVVGSWQMQLSKFQQGTLAGAVCLTICYFSEHGFELFLVLCSMVMGFDEMISDGIIPSMVAMIRNMELELQ